jgi:AcrR family transcriptional regulator
LFHREGISATDVERLTGHARVSKSTFYRHISNKNDLVEESLRRIHQAGGVPTEQAIDNHRRLAAQPPTGLVDGTPGGRFRRPFHNAGVAAGRNVNHPVCLMP